jgi:hypothetical protein
MFFLSEEIDDRIFFQVLTGKDPADYNKESRACTFTLQQTRLLLFSLDTFLAK